MAEDWSMSLILLILNEHMSLKYQRKVKEPTHGDVSVFSPKLTQIYISDLIFLSWINLLNIEQKKILLMN